MDWGVAPVSGSNLRQRLAAILAADAVGYSRLMSIDERATVAALDAARSVFHAQTMANQGRVVDTAGDSVLAVFQTAAGALNAALQIQAELAEAGKGIPVVRRMLFRIGIHAGDVMEKADGSVYGDGVNIAARLQALAEPGQITVSDVIHGAVRGKVSASFTDQGEQQVKNIEHPVRVYRVQVGGRSDSATIAVARSPVGEIDLSLPDKPSIAVLAFVNISGDPEQEYFTDGITEDIITELSRFHSLFVIARNSSFTYKGKPVDVRTVSKELGVRYVLEGSIRRAGDRIRVTAQLIDALTGKHIWAEKYDRVLADIFEVQEDLTRRIVMIVVREVDSMELAKAQRPRPGNLSAYEIGLRALTAAWAASQTSGPSQIHRACQLAHEALAIDPNCYVALNALAAAHFLEVFLRTTSDFKTSYRLCVEASERAIAIDRSAHHPYLWRGLLEVLSATPAVKAAGLSRLRSAYENNPNDAISLWFLGQGETLCGNHVNGRRLAFEALRMSPRDPYRWAFADALALAHFLAQEYQVGLDWVLRCVEEAPQLLTAHEHAAVIFVGLGRLEEAQREFAWVHIAAPEQSAMLLQRGWLHLGDLGQRARASLFFRIAAGLEDPSAADALR